MVWPGLVDANDPDRLLAVVAIAVNNRCAEINMAVVLLPRGIDNLGNLHSFAQESQSPVDLAQALFAVNVIAVLRAVAIARSPGDRLNDVGALDFLQLGKFLLEPLKALRSNVIFGAGRQRGDFAFEILVGFRLLGKSFVHGASQM